MKYFKCFILLLFIHFFLILDKGCYDIVEKNFQEFFVNGRNGLIKDLFGIERNVIVGNVIKK